MSLLALGVGTAGAVSSLIHAVLLRPAPWPAASRLVAIHAVRPDWRNDPAFSRRWDREPLSWADWDELQGSPVFDRIGVWMPRQEILASAEVDLVDVFYASSSFLPLLGVRPSIGRLFVAAEDRAPSDSVILTHEAWRTHFGARTTVLGETVALAPNPTGQPAVKTVVGVLPPMARFQGESPAFFLPIGVMAFNGRFDTNRFLRAIGRLAPDTSIEQARAVVEPLIRRVDLPSERTARLAFLAEDVAGEDGSGLWIVFTAALLLMLVSCSSVAGLLLINGQSRERELAVRLSLGARRMTIVRQLVVEHFVLGTLGVAGGVLAGRLVLPVLVALGPATSVDDETIGLNVPIALASATTGLLVTILLGSIPAVRLTRRSDLTMSRRLTDGTRRKLWLHRSIVVGQSALALTLAVSATAFGTTLLSLRREALGFKPEDVMVADIRFTRAPAGAPPSDGATAQHDATPNHPPDIEEQHRRELLGSSVYVDGVLRRLAMLPDAQAVAAATAVPFGRPSRRAQARAYERPEAEAQTVQRIFVTDGYFETLRIAVLAGRLFARGQSATTSAVVSKELERRLFPTGAVGRKVVVGTAVYDVIGVVENVKLQDARELASPILYNPAITANGIQHILVRSSKNSDRTLALLRSTIQDHDDGIRVLRSAPLTTRVAESMSGHRFRAVVSLLFAVSATIVLAVGIFVLTERFLAERRREIAVRLALGARPDQIQTLVIRDVSLVVIGGLGVGLPGVHAASRIAQSLVSGIEPLSAHVWLTAALGVGVAVLCGAIWPILRAGAISPADALRE